MVLKRAEKIFSRKQNDKRKRTKKLEIAFGKLNPVAKTRRAKSPARMKVRKKAIFTSSSLVNDLLRVSWGEGSYPNVWDSQFHKKKNQELAAKLGEMLKDKRECANQSGAITSCSLVMTTGLGKCQTTLPSMTGTQQTLFSNKRTS